MPVSDFKMLLSKLVAALTILPGVVYGVALLSGVLLFGVAFATTLINGTGDMAVLGSIAGIYGQVALAILAVLACVLLWYLPFIALVGAIATVVGRWAIPIAVLLPAITSVLEWVTLGGLHPFATNVYRFMSYRLALPQTPYAESWLVSTAPFDGLAFTTDLIAGIDWLQVGLGAAFALVVLYLASEYRRRFNTN